MPKKSRGRRPLAGTLTIGWRAPTSVLPTLFPLLTTASSATATASATTEPSTMKIGRGCLMRAGP